MESLVFANSTAVTFVTAFFLSYLYHGLGITLGYHRLLTHKSLKVPKWLEYLIVSGGYMGLMGSPILWVAVHRLHHLKSDQPGDPHSPRDGFTHALYKWMFEMDKMQSDEEVKSICADLMHDPIYRWTGIRHKSDQAMRCLLVCIAFRVVLLALFGPFVVVANLLASFIIFWSTQFVNTFCHMEAYGYRTFHTREDSRNVWWVGWLALGEGWHNNHHAIPKSARHGLNWREFDITWVTIWALERLGLAQSVVRPNLTVQEARRKKVPAAGVCSKAQPVPVPVEELEDYNRSMLVGVGEEHR